MDYLDDKFDSNLDYDKNITVLDIKSDIVTVKI